MNPVLFILIATIPERQELLRRLLKELQRQKDALPNPGLVRFLVNYDNKTKTTGAKRNELIDASLEQGAKVFAFHDDDDLPGETYLKRGLEVVDSGMDCGELWGQIYWNGVKGMPFHHSIQHDHWWQDNQYYYRNPNHLNFLRAETVRDIRYKDITIGEDGQYSLELAAKGVLKNQYPIPEIIYHYFNGSPKHAI